MALIISGTTGITDDAFDYEDEINSKAAKTYVDSKPSGFKNYIINGGFDIWQRGTSHTSHGYGSADRWILDASRVTSGTSSFSQVSKPYNGYLGLLQSGSNYFMNFTYTDVVIPQGDTSGALSIDQWIEDGINKMVGKTMTLSIRAASDSSNFSVGLGTSDSNGVWCAFALEKFAVDVVMSTYSVTFTMPDYFDTTNNSNVLLYINVAGSTSWLEEVTPTGKTPPTEWQNDGSYMNIDYVQLEEGSVATPFEQRPYGLELSLCRRYYQYNHYTTTPNNTGAVNEWGFMYANMRVTPSANVANCNFEGHHNYLPILQQVKNTSIEMAYTGAAYRNYTNRVTGDLYLSAEL